MKSTLPLTGKCHYCGEPTPYRFCKGTSCQRLYWYRQENPEVKQVQDHSKRVCWTEKKLSWSEIERRMDEIAARVNDTSHTWESVTRPGATMRCRRIG